MYADAYQPFTLAAPAPEPVPVTHDAADGFSEGLAAARFTRFRDDRAQTLAALAALAAPGASPLPWFDGLKALQTLPAPLFLAHEAWDRIVWTAIQLHNEWGEQAHTAGWDALELFGANPVRTATRNDRDGLSLLISAWDGPIAVSAVTDDHIALTVMGGGILRWRRFDRSGAVPIWEAFAMHGGP